MKRFARWIVDWLVIGCICIFWMCLSWWNRLRGKEDDWF